MAVRSRNWTWRKHWEIPKVKYMKSERQTQRYAMQARSWHVSGALGSSHGTWLAASPASRAATGLWSLDMVTVGNDRSVRAAVAGQNSATVRFRPSLCLPHPQIQPHSLQHHRLFSRRTNKCPTTCFWCSTQPFPWLLNHHRDGHTQPSHGHGSSAASQAFRFRAARSEEVVAVVVVDTS
jgi:hypothetical protein